MPTTVPIEVFRIGHTVVDEAEVQRWLDHIGAHNFDWPEEEEVTNPALLIALAGKRCYMSFVEGLNPNVTRIRRDYVAYFDNILASGHGSVLEHSVYNFAIEGVSRVFTGEMNRHRAGWAISEGSMRFIRYSDSIPYWEPDSIRGPDVETAKNLAAIMLDPDNSPSAVMRMISDNCDSEQLLNNKKQLSRELFRLAFSGQEAVYRALETVWADELAPDSKFADKKHITSMMRRIVGMGVATGGVWSGNIRALRHVFTLRASAAAEEEMLHVFSRVAKVMAEKEPLLFGDFHQNEQGFWVPKYVKV